jgi:hypothetical protein
MSLFEQATQLNNEGVTALLKGESQAAIDAMSKSIRLMTQELSKPSEDRKSDCTTAASEQEEARSVEIPETDSFETIVFNQAIIIPSDGGEQSGIDVHVYSAAVIFNLALVHHLQASKGDIACMAKAEKLYATVLKLVDDRACHMRVAVLVKLASMNNLSQIRYAKGEYEHAREGLNQLSSFLRRTNQALFEEPQVQGLLMNALLLKAPKVAPAA